MITSLKDCVEKYNYLMNLSYCVSQPLQPGLDKFAQNDETARAVRNRVLAFLSGKEEYNDDFVFACERYCWDHFRSLVKIMKAYTIDYGIAEDLDFEVTIEHIKQEAIAFCLEKTEADGIFDPKGKVWKDEKANYEKKTGRTRNKAVESARRCL